MKLPLFPLSSHLLPEGRLALRIFEPRYTRMIRESCKQGTGFVICMFNPTGNKFNNTHIYPRGTYCEIIDFDVLPDGLLGVTVEGKYCVEILQIATEGDELRVGECQIIDLWQGHAERLDIEKPKEKLREIFESYPDVTALYQGVTRFDDAEWVINRWIELLPLNAEQKQEFIALGDSAQVLEYLNHLID